MWSEPTEGSCVAKIRSSATRPHPVDSQGFPCRKTQTRNIELVRRVSRQGDRDTGSNPRICRRLLQMAPGAATVGSTPTSCGTDPPSNDPFWFLPRGVAENPASHSRGVAIVFTCDPDVGPESTRFGFLLVGRSVPHEVGQNPVNSLRQPHDSLHQVISVRSRHSLNHDTAQLLSKRSVKWRLMA